MNATTAPVTIPTNLDDTARLILMDQPGMNAAGLRHALYLEGQRPTVEQMQALTRKYLGYGVEFATHSIATGKRYL